MKAIETMKTIKTFKRTIRHFPPEAERFTKFRCKRSDPSFRIGFTLLEMVVSFGIFSVVIITAFGALLSINSAQIKAANIQNIQDNLRFALESMAREMRFGKSFIPSDGAGPAYLQIAFTRRDGTAVGYCLNDTMIKQLSGGSSNCSLGSVVTDESIVVDQLVFYLIGQAPPPDNVQPRITIVIRAHSKDPKLATSFALQTTITPRLRDQ